MAYYKQHVFFCVNQRDNGKKCCNYAGATTACQYAKHRIDELGLKGKGRIRISSAGCLGRCADGPVLVIYPEGAWYTYSSESDVEKIIQSHLIQGEPVNELMLSAVDNSI